MKNIEKIYLVIVSFFLINLVSYGQIELSNTINSVTKYPKYADTEGKEINPPAPRNVSLQEIVILKEMEQLKSSENKNGEKLIQLQRKLDLLTGESVTVQCGYYPGKIIFSQNNPPFIQPLMIGNSRIYNGNMISSIATATETNGATAGRIWLAFSVRGSNTTSDSVKFYTSVNGGLSWTWFATSVLWLTDRVNFYDMDIELIEPPTGDKYLHAVYGMRESNGTGRWITGGTTMRITGTISGNIYQFVWPGDNQNNRYYNIKITSDNGWYPSNSYTYIAISFDSVYSSNLHYNAQKIARCLDPNTLPPVITYHGSKIGWSQSGNAIERKLYTDIAYFRNSQDSLIIVFSGIPDSTKLFFTKTNISGILPGNLTGPIGGSVPNQHKNRARISSNQNNNGSIIVYFNEYITATTRGLKYFRTINYGNFNNIAGESIIWTGNYNLGCGYPSIYGIKNSDRHRLAVTLWKNGFDSVFTFTVNSSGQFFNTSGRMNNLENVSGNFTPEVGIRNVNGDSCLVFFGSLYLDTLWAAFGCSGAISGIEKNLIPFKFSLSQNYPNPFNPVTKIQYDIAKKSDVTLSIYDILGKHIETMVNETKDAGSYIVEYNASALPSGLYFYKLEAGNFSEVKKMVLIK